MQTNYKFLETILVLNITFQLVSDVVAGKIVQVFGQNVSASVIFFPFTFIISDIVTEVYGYTVARRILIRTLYCSILAGILYQIAIVMPGAGFFEHSMAYTEVLGVVPRILLAGWIAVYCGDLSNNYVLARLKLLTGEGLLWLRTISSTVVGQGINTFLFYVIGLSGVLPYTLLFQSILAGWSMKIIVEMVMTPVVYIVTDFLKKREGISALDTWLVYEKEKMSPRFSQNP